MPRGNQAVLVLYSDSHVSSRRRVTFKGHRRGSTGPCSDPILFTGPRTQENLRKKGAARAVHILARINQAAVQLLSRCALCVTRRLRDTHAAYFTLFSSLIYAQGIWAECGVYGFQRGYKGRIHKLKPQVTKAAEFVPQDAASFSPLSSHILPMEFWICHSSMRRTDYWFVCWWFKNIDSVSFGGFWNLTHDTDAVLLGLPTVAAISQRNIRKLGPHHRLNTYMRIK